MGVNIQTIKDIRLYLARELEMTYPKEEISALTNIIIKTVTGITKLHILSMPDQKITSDQAERIIDICNELKKGKPLQYILGETLFYNCTINVTADTLIPRPETEELVDLIIRENSEFQGKILDIGTGSGCIAIALAKNLPGSNVTGIDISQNAIKVARENAITNNVNVTFIEEDILNPHTGLIETADIIVSNPPYVRLSEKKSMNDNVLDYEPHISLFVPDSDPLLFYKAIIKTAERVLRRHGLLYFEINEEMGKQMFMLLEAYRYQDVKIIPDINNKERIIKGRKNG